MRMRRNTIVVVLGLLTLAACGEQAVTQDTLPAVAPVTTTMRVATSTSSTSSTSTTTSTTTTTTEVPVTEVPVTEEPTTLPPITAAPVVTQPAPTKNSVSVRADRRIGSMRIPRLDLTIGFVEGIDDRSLNLGVGHWPGTAMPGHVGNAVFGGHRVSHTKPFRNIDKLQPGDEVTFQTSEGVFTYAVSKTEILAPTAVWIVNPTPDATATLFACHPPGSTRQRIVVFLKLIS